MTPEIREKFRENIIALIAAAGTNGLKRASLKMHLLATGHDAATDADLDNDLDYLAGKGLVEKKEKAVSPEVARWKITAQGRDYAAEEGIA